jgi:hypothetical protein
LISQISNFYKLLVTSSELYLVEFTIIISIYLLYIRIKKLKKNVFNWLIFAIGLPIGSFLIQLTAIYKGLYLNEIYIICSIYLISPTALLIASLFIASPDLNTTRPFYSRYIQKTKGFFSKIFRIHLIRSRFYLLSTGIRRLLSAITIITFPIFHYTLYNIFGDGEEYIERNFSNPSFVNTLLVSIIIYYMIISTTLWIISGFIQDSSSRNETLSQKSE